MAGKKARKPLWWTRASLREPQLSRFNRNENVCCLVSSISYNVSPCLLPSQSRVDLRSANYFFTPRGPYMPSCRNSTPKTFPQGRARLLTQLFQT